MALDRSTVPMELLGKVVDKSSEWSKTDLPVNGIPKQWRAVEKRIIWLDGRQFAYQNYLAGNITSKLYDVLRKDWNINPEFLSTKPLKCFVYTVNGVDRTGRDAFMVDTDNDLSFSDETAFYPDTVYFNVGKLDVDVLNRSEKQIMVEYQSIHEAKIVNDSLPILIKYSPEFDEKMKYFYCIPRYGKTQLTWKGRTYEIAVNNHFSDASFDDAKIFLVNGKNSEPKYDFHQGIATSEILEIPNATFRNLGINLASNQLVLKQEIADKEEYSLQQGYLLRPFVAKDFLTGTPISSSNFKGKYLFIDFWGTWCKGCVEQLPELREIYEHSNKNRISFLGIAADNPNKLASFLKNKPIQWQQVLSDSINNLIEIYNIKGFPTNVLVDPKGRVVKRNITLEELRNMFVAKQEKAL